MSMFLVWDLSLNLLQGSKIVCVCVGRRAHVCRCGGQMSTLYVVPQVLSNFVILSLGLSLGSGVC